MEDIRNISELFTAKISGDSTETVVGQLTGAVRSVQDLLGNNAVPASIESTSADLPKGTFKQVDINELENALKNEFDKDGKFDFSKLDPDTKISDLDGDGVPDGYDKNPNMTVADVAASICKIGKYAVTAGRGTKNANSIKTVAHMFRSCINGLNESLAAASIGSSFGKAEETREVRSLLGKIIEGNGVPKAMDLD